MIGLRKNRDWQYYFVNQWSSLERIFPTLFDIAVSRTDNYEVRRITILGFVFGMREENIDYLLNEAYSEKKRISDKGDTGG